VNTAILGAFVKVTGVVKLESLLKAIKEIVPIKPEDNAAAAQEAHDSVTIEEG
ncbi:MAG: pyruvate ferredoxin oxidoreductase, partial [Candidatus Cloacimonadota bacterium]